VLYRSGLSSLAPARSDARFASIYRTLGSGSNADRQSKPNIAWREPEAADRVAEALEMRGVNIVRNQQLALDEIRESEIGILVRGQDGQIVDADVALVATGRRPNSCLTSSA
jgi:pyruvate/2-oxoglutarate dehydrogenase complex dihydrolipoamide dehydrogenase (E3) component